jgi:RNA polymerase sigma factor (TIGR02999 family)
MTGAGQFKQEDINRLLHRWGEGDVAARDALFPLLYDELRQLARRRLAGERADHTLQGTALVNEAYLRLSGQRVVEWQNRSQFLALASQMMRRILVDYARQRDADKRGAGSEALSLDDTRAALQIEAAQAAQVQDALHAAENARVDLLAIDHAVSRLTVIDAQQGHIVELRYFGGLTVEETAEVVGLSPATIKREWVLARAWLHRDLSSSFTA